MHQEVEIVRPISVSDVRAAEYASSGRSPRVPDVLPRKLSRTPFGNTRPRKWRPWTGLVAQLLNSSPERVSGAWVLRGTRMTVATIFENLEAGANLDDSWYDGVDREQVKALLDFAVRSLAPSASGR